ncbi:MAG: 50S ribosomal protein L32 [bacterium (Candidatus Stahlbacteria) CG23_combo_of_CG06-09_8_20_14_all_34_7]|nr:MAG: 50S ribosomal protein L32 [bacterium (Candidatus Stahlbacteria) CG23_combo_of_CG06-09_8_20_14_all_34_7]
MAVPKRRHSRARGRKRRTHWKLFKPALTICSHCGAMIRSHSICPTCGYYNGKEYITIKKEV